ncbi:MAG: alpha/beta hydrolase [Rhizobacter sp.]|nr:alpha/beta hydrolase [Ferruginibacter sp.]
MSLFVFSCKKTSTQSSGNADEPYIKQTVQYKLLPNTAANLLSLDIYHYSNSSLLKPVVIYVHGGGWRIGDKANNPENKIALFQSLHYIFVSINYRLSPNPSQLSNASRIKYPDHNNDVADAVKWVIDSIGNYGGDPAKIALIGHSAGAHLVSLTGSSQLFLPARNIPLAAIKGIATVDTEGYDVTSQSSEELYQNAFGTDPAIQVQASPIFNLANVYTYPNFFVAKRGTTTRIALADTFINRLQSVGVNVQQVNGSQYDHEGINNAIGDPNDTVITPALKVFLANCFQ